MSRKIALITGGSRGLGRNAAIHLAENGIDSIVTYRTGRAEADEVVAEIARRGGKGAALSLDVGDVSRFPAFAEEVGAKLGETWGRRTFDFLVNNAGHGDYATVADTTEEQFDSLLNVHFKGPFFLTQRMLPLMEDGGRILNVSTGLTRFAFPGYSVYGSAKGALETLTRYLAKELGARNISVNSLAPGAVATDFGGGAVRDSEELQQGLAAQTAMGRVGRPDDIGGVIAALLSGETQWITGQRIEASGGLIL